VSASTTTLDDFIAACEAEIPVGLPPPLAEACRWAIAEMRDEIDDPRTVLALMWLVRQRIAAELEE
jgi:hypothetical protein